MVERNQFARWFFLKVQFRKQWQEINQSSLSGLGWPILQVSFGLGSLSDNKGFLKILTFGF